MTVNFVLIERRIISASPPHRIPRTRDGHEQIGLFATRATSFAVHSSINGRFAMSGAGTAAYRFCRLVHAPE
jgi:hypothetical protein